MLNDDQRGAAAPPSAVELIGEISASWSRWERCVLSGEDVDLDPVRELVDRLGGEARSLAADERISTASQLLGLVADCDDLILQLTRELANLRQATADRGDHAETLMAYARNAYGSR